MSLVTGILSRRDTFPYRRLADGEIRVLWLKKHADWPHTNSLTCTIRNVNIDDVQNVAPYIALSYVWGDGRDVVGLTLQDETTEQSGEITITRSLLEALQSVFTTEKTYSLWIDQICIDQSNIAEKGHQVRLMKQIYERAAAVYIWLGPASHDSQMGIEYLKTASIESIQRDFSDSELRWVMLDVSKAIKGILSRPYWNRTWTILESTALSFEKTRVLCGDLSVSLLSLRNWKDARIEMHLDTRKSGHQNATSYDDLSHEIMRVTVFAHARIYPRRPLYDLVGKLRKLQASDPRDKIYSLLDYATDIQHDELKADYSKSVRQVYTEFFLWFTNKYQCLDMLRDCHPSLEDDEAPSWLPDWSQPETASPFHQTADPTRFASTALFSAGGQWPVAQNMHNTIPLEVDTRILSLSGVRISTLQWVQHKPGGCTELWQVQQSWEPLDSYRVCALNDLPMNVVFRRTICLDSRYLGETAMFVRLRVEDPVLTRTVEPKSLTEEDVVNQKIMNFMANSRCPFYAATSPGSPHSLLGYAHEDTKPGDELWILRGGKMPLILRPKAMTVRTTDFTKGKVTDLPVDIGMPTYQYVSEAFVLGLMDGQIFDMLGDNPKRKRPPPLAEMDREFRTIGLL